MVSVGWKFKNKELSRDAIGRGGTRCDVKKVVDSSFVRVRLTATLLYLMLLPVEPNTSISVSL